MDTRRPHVFAPVAIGRPPRTVRLDLLLESIACGLLQYYEVRRPPVPILQMLGQPPRGLERDLDLCVALPYGEAAFVRLLSGQGVVFVNPELPLPRQRFASARNMLRGDYHSPRGRALGLSGTAPVPHSAAEEYYARCLLMPVSLLPLRWPAMTAEELADLFAVPPDAAAARLAELNGGRAYSQN